MQVCAEFRNPVGLITKNHLITRDLDVLGELASFKGVATLYGIGKTFFWPTMLGVVG